VHEEPVRPRLEAGGVAELREVLPDGEQRLLRRVLGEVHVTQNPARHGKEPIGDVAGKEGVCPLVTALGPDHDVGIHATSAHDIGIV
jgi:hypothetical protein